ITAMTTTGESEENGTFTVNSASVRLPNAAMEKVYPNPVTGGILMITSNAMSGPQLLRIIDGRGSIVKKISVTPEEATLKVDVRDLPSGAYTCEIMGKTLRLIRFIIP
ncbi:MAG TPA: T9SS type A sorting domain-containing protein, partial [Candidatus Kapabacteria bacterium]|nr:T9SS type A sorting domain-containing protein [Candidatus Kapabacteria bacterium]